MVGGAGWAGLGLNKAYQGLRVWVNWFPKVFLGNQWHWGYCSQKTWVHMGPFSIQASILKALSYPYFENFGVRFRPVFPPTLWHKKPKHFDESTHWGHRYLGPHQWHRALLPTAQALRVNQKPLSTDSPQNQQETASQATYTRGLKLTICNHHTLTSRQVSKRHLQSHLWSFDS